MPGVAAVSTAELEAAQRKRWTMSVFIEGHTPRPDEDDANQS
ncbi:MAG: hypothetical protein WKF84_09715 [Pyrinomonadaceae bacterium]